jgi:hypothetical protein
MERYIVFIANIKDSEVTVNGFVFEIENGRKLPVRKGFYDELLGESPLRLNNAVMEIVGIGAESLNDQVPRPIEGNSGQNETESTTILIAEADEGIPGENGMCGTLSIEDKDKTVSASTSASESKEIVDNSGRENSNITTTNNESKTGQEQEKTGTQTKLPGTPATSGGTAPQQQVTIEQQHNRASLTRTKLSGTPVEGGGTAFELPTRQHNRGSHYHNFTPDEPAPHKERGETESGHGKSVVIHQPELQNENSIVHVSSEKDNPSNQEDSDRHLSSSVRKGRRMGFSCGLCFSCSS